MPGNNKKSSDREKVLEHIIRETLWMARRYADGRRSFAPTIVNECIELAKANGIEIGVEVGVDGPTGKMYASDGDLGEWKDGKFEKEPGNAKQS